MEKMNKNQKSIMKKLLKQQQLIGTIMIIVGSFIVGWFASQIGCF